MAQSAAVMGVTVGPGQPRPCPPFTWQPSMQFPTTATMMSSDRHLARQRRGGSRAPMSPLPPIWKTWTKVMAQRPRSRASFAEGSRACADCPGTSARMRSAPHGYGVSRPSKHSGTRGPATAKPDTCSDAYRLSHLLETIRAPLPTAPLDYGGSIAATEPKQAPSDLLPPARPDRLGSHGRHSCHLAHLRVFARILAWAAARAFRRLRSVARFSRSELADRPWTVHVVIGRPIP